MRPIRCFLRLASASVCRRQQTGKSATSDTSMVSRGFPSIVTGYSHSIDVVVRRRLYLLPRGGTHFFRYQVEFCSKERGNEKTSSTCSIAIPCYRNCFCRYAEERRSATCQGGSTG